jgi:hypothetical protein
MAFNIMTLGIKAFSITTFGITAISITTPDETTILTAVKNVTLSITINICGTQHNNEKCNLQHNDKQHHNETMTLNITTLIKTLP